MRISAGHWATVAMRWWRRREPSRPWEAHSTSSIASWRSARGCSPSRRPFRGPGIRMPAHERRRIVYVIDSLVAGGTERHLVRLIEGMLHTGRWEIAVYCLARTGAFVPVVEKMGVDVTGSDDPWSKSPESLWRSVRALHSYL